MMFTPEIDGVVPIDSSPDRFAHVPLWPWLLIALQKRPLHRLVTRLVTEVDADASR
jgi:hypothetical protein